jgi:hypothetical protein
MGREGTDIKGKQDQSLVTTTRLYENSFCYWVAVPDPAAEYDYMVTGHPPRATLLRIANASILLELGSPGGLDWEDRLTPRTGAADGKPLTRVLDVEFVCDSQNNLQLSCHDLGGGARSQV